MRSIFSELAKLLWRRHLCCFLLRRNERLASDSEAVVKAEASHSANQSIEELQKQTVEIVTVRGRCSLGPFVQAVPVVPGGRGLLQGLSDRERA